MARSRVYAYESVYLASSFLSVVGCREHGASTTVFTLRFDVQPLVQNTHNFNAFIIESVENYVLADDVGPDARSDFSSIPPLFRIHQEPFAQTLDIPDVLFCFRISPRLDRVVPDLVKVDFCAWTKAQFPHGLVSLNRSSQGYEATEPCSARRTLQAMLVAWARGGTQQCAVSGLQTG